MIHNAGYDTHFIMEQLAEDFKGQFDCIEDFFCANLKKNVMMVKQSRTN